MLTIKTVLHKHLVRNVSLLATFVVVAVLAVIFSMNLTTRHRVNATLAGFDAGNIVDDPTMANVNSMNVGDIQNFLNSQNSCNKAVSGAPVTATSSTSAYYNYNSGLTYSIRNGRFLCLANATFDNNGMPTSGNGTSAAQIIYNAAHKFNINPQVLIVLLQKEQGLVTDDWPNSGEYQNATGYGCPDTAPCSTSGRGLVNQLEGAAYLFRTVLNGGWSNYPAYQTTYIQYSPDVSCGGSNVYVQNRATSGLYRYTPYQPNAGAMAAGWGTASCGAYGNRNFYNYFTSWFGSTQSDVYTPGPGNIVIPNGTYSISSYGRTLDVAGGQSANGSSVDSFAYNGTGAQQWIINRLSNGYYTIQNPQSGKYLDVVGANVYNRSPIDIYDGNGSNAQQWAITANPKGGYTIQTVVSGRAIDISGNSFNNGAAITTFSKNDSMAQNWNFIPTQPPVANGTYTLNVAASNTVMDIAGGATSNGSSVNIYQPNGTGAQKWVVTRLANNNYTLMNPQSGKYLDVRGAGTAPGTGIDIYGGNGTCAQQWQFLAGNNGYSLASACSGIVLDIPGGNMANDNRLQLYFLNGTAAQAWKFNPTN